MSDPGSPLVVGPRVGIPGFGGDVGLAGTQIRGHALDWMLPEGAGTQVQAAGNVTGASASNGVVSFTSASAGAQSFTAGYFVFWPLVSTCWKAVLTSLATTMNDLGLIGVRYRSVVDNTGLAIAVGVTDGTNPATMTGPFVGVEFTSAVLRTAIVEYARAGAVTEFTDSTPATIDVARAVQTFYSIQDPSASAIAALRSAVWVDSAGLPISGYLLTGSGTLTLAPATPMYLSLAVWRRSVATAAAYTVSVSQFVQDPPASGYVCP